MEISAKTDAVVRKDIEQRTLNAKQLLEKHYYAAWDCGTGDSRLESRAGPTGAVETHSKLYYLYPQDACIVWNGNTLTKDSVDSLIKHILEMKTKHTIRTLDVQSIMDSNHSLVTVTGTCTYNDEAKRNFSHMLILWKEVHPEQPERAMHWVIHDNFRWI
eukprot:TRINITY_DN38906_c0_g1_i1.p1 TRINITY_DN38906_c0_g1~~TRINITY_DN38906_c0_g1_i1.p1  ORF type:complete len:184 (+),score=23.42 TRINITY_DN38906_c0_g1_i1:74-553(+)